MRETARAARAVMGHPALWATALVQYRRMLPDAWWRRRPFLPVPDAAMLAFRTTTQYGGANHPPEPDDLLTWLRWCKAENRRTRIG